MAGKQTDPDSLYSMKVVARLTGLSADTIRKWEQRYGAIEPKRTEGNTRKFTSEDVKKLTLLKRLTTGGHSIREVARLPPEQLEQLLAEATGVPEPSGVDPYVDLRKAYLDHVHAYRVHEALDLLSRAALVIKPSEIVYQVVLPILRTVGDLWEHGSTSVAQEHLASAQLRGLLTQMRHWSTPGPGAPRVVITTPEGHLHEFGALVATILASTRGFDPIYLGPNLPEADIEEALRQSKSDLLILSVVRDSTEEERKAQVPILKRLAKRTETWLGLPEDHVLAKADTGARLFHSFEDLEMALTQRTSFDNR